MEEAEPSLPQILSLNPQSPAGVEGPGRGMCGRTVCRACGGGEADPRAHSPVTAQGVRVKPASLLPQLVQAHAPPRHPLTTGLGSQQSAGQRHGLKPKDAKGNESRFPAPPPKGGGGVLSAPWTGDQCNLGSKDSSWLALGYTAGVTPEPGCSG